jgi:hypothetical protein
MKVSAWLLEFTDSHVIQDDSKMRAKFEADTNHPCPWRSHTKNETVKAIKGRGLGGTLTADNDTQLCYGYEMAAACARKFAGFSSDKMGRGFMFRDCIEALQKAGL